MFLVLLPFAVVAARLAHLQLVPSKHEEMERLSQHVRTRFSSPRRGRILSRDGEVLAQNRALFSLHFRYSLLNPRHRALDVLMAEFARQSAPFDRVEVENLILGLEDPGRLTAMPDPETPAADEWRPLVRKVGAALGRRLPRWTGLRGMFEVRRGEDGEHTLGCYPRAALRFEITLERLAALLARAKSGGQGSAGGPPADARQLRERVAGALENIEKMLLGRAERDAERGLSRDLVTRRTLEDRKTWHERHDWILLEDVPEEVVTVIEYHPELFPGIRVVDDTKRVYPRGEAFGTLTGYLRPLFAADLERREKDGQLLESLRGVTSREEFIARRDDVLRREDLIGAGGLESSYDRELRGQLGMLLVEADSRGRTRALLDEVAAVDGTDLVTTLDTRLQELLYLQLAARVRPEQGHGAGTAASAVVLDPRTGAVLAAAGFPGVDPNRQRDPEYREELERTWGEQTDGWELDRPVLHALYPGSVFKVVAAAAALEGGVPWEGPFSPERGYPCNHTFDLDKHFRCAAEYGHTPDRRVDLVEALQYSCNNYFFWVGAKHLGYARLREWAETFGFGEPTGIDLPPHLAERGELRGAEEVRGLEVCLSVIGQVHVRATPLQVARAMAAVATGDLPSPYLVRPRGAKTRLPLRASSLEWIRRGMWAAAHHPDGTAGKPEHGLSPYRVAVKTGTAQRESRRGGPHLAWVAGFAPAAADGKAEARIAFAVVVEETELGGADASAPVVSALLEHLAREDAALYRLETLASPTAAPAALRND
jgi:penicillin-binding protein 2